MQIIAYDKNEILKKKQEELMGKHFKRMEGFLVADLEGRDITEQRIILEQAKKVIEKLLEDL